MRRDKKLPHEDEVVELIEEIVPSVIASKLSEHAVAISSIDPCSETYNHIEIQTIITTLNDVVSILQQLGILTPPPPPSY